MSRKSTPEIDFLQANKRKRVLTEKAKQLEQHSRKKTCTQTTSNQTSSNSNALTPTSTQDSSSNERTNNTKEGGSEKNAKDTGRYQNTQHIGSANGDSIDDDIVQLTDTETEIYETDLQATADDPQTILSKCKYNIYPFNNIPFDPEKQMRKWVAPIYAFFHPTPTIEYDGKGRVHHVFACSNKGCVQKVRRCTGTKDAQSTSNMRRHVKTCFGEEALKVADNMKGRDEARKTVVKDILRNGSITEAFDSVGGRQKVMYSTRPLTRVEMK